MARLKEDEIIPPGSKWEKEDPWPGHPAFQRCHSLWRGAWRNGFREGAECERLQGNIRGDCQVGCCISGAQGRTGGSGSEDGRSGTEALVEISEDFCLRSRSPGGSGQEGCQERWTQTHTPHPFSTLSGGL